MVALGCAISASASASESSFGSLFLLLYVWGRIHAFVYGISRITLQPPTHYSHSLLGEMGDDAVSFPHPNVDIPVLVSPPKGFLRPNSLFFWALALPHLSHFGTSRYCGWFVRDPPAPVLLFSIFIYAYPVARQKFGIETCLFDINIKNVVVITATAHPHCQCCHYPYPKQVFSHI